MTSKQTGDYYLYPVKPKCINIVYTFFYDLKALYCLKGIFRSLVKGYIYIYMTIHEGFLWAIKFLIPFLFVLDTYLRSQSYFEGKTSTFFHFYFRKYYLVRILYFLISKLYEPQCVCVCVSLYEYDY